MVAGSKAVRFSLATILALVCSVLAVALAPVMPAGPEEATSSTTFTADVNSSGTIDMYQVRRLKEFSGMSQVPPGLAVAGGTAGGVTQASVADILGDGTAALSMSSMAFICRCSLDLCILLLTLSRLKPWGSMATRPNSTIDPVAPCERCSGSRKELASHGGDRRARELLLAWDSFDDILGSVAAERAANSGAQDSYMQGAAYWRLTQR
eukprot:CAMPEP_0179115560 /NCGR_PEP_ID=MMETSP0796-20121207/54163_1 /TAXON_ID=73915 /ORGANISM="Pyrodinium bahamense, Strain pbaha01" /LENGTH=208 /DNA_ID=CAMNT_0020813815 /DNA_START=123 /DNA_END=750 /DNA_ORIENTATION=+